MKTYLKYACCMIILWLSFSNKCFSQDVSNSSSAALDLLKIMNMEQTLSNAIDVMIDAQLKANPSLKQYEDILRDFMKKYMSWTFLQDKLIKIYSDEFTEQELRELIKFYQTDIGKKMISKMPILLEKGSALGQQAIQEHLPELTEAIQKRSNN